MFNMILCWSELHPRVFFRYLVKNLSFGDHQRHYSSSGNHECTKCHRDPDISNSDQCGERTNNNQQKDVTGKVMQITCQSKDNVLVYPHSLTCHVISHLLYWHPHMNWIFHPKQCTEIIFWKWHLYLIISWWSKETQTKPSNTTVII